MADNELIRSVNKAEEPGHELLEPASKRVFSIRRTIVKFKVSKLNGV